MSHFKKADHYLRHDHLTWIDRQLHDQIRELVTVEVRKVAEPVLLEAVEEAMRRVSSRLVASQSDEYLLGTTLKLQVNLSLRVDDE